MSRVSEQSLLAKREQLERETELLLKQRREIGGRIDQAQLGESPSPDFTPNTVSQSSYQTAKVRTKKVLDKIQEVIECIRNDSSLTPQEASEIIHSQQNVLDYIRTKGQLPNSKNLRNGPSFNSQVNSQLHKQLHQQPILAQPPQMQQSNPSSQFTQEIADHSVHSKLLQSVDSHQQVPIYHQFHSPAMIQSIPAQPEQSGVHTHNLSEDTLSLIEAIQSKALNQIMILKAETDQARTRNQQLETQNQHLKEGMRQRDQMIEQLKQREQLMEQQRANRAPSAEVIYQAAPQNANYQIHLERLTEENRLLRSENEELERMLEEQIKNGKALKQNQLKQKQGNAHYEEGLRNAAIIEDLRRQLEQAQRNPTSVEAKRAESIIRELREQLEVESREVRRAESMIQQLKDELQKSYGARELHEQGETIRQGTVHLIKMKEAQAPQASSRIRELQAKVQEDQKERIIFLRDLQLFKQKYHELQEENRQLRAMRSEQSIPRNNYEGESLSKMPSTSMMKVNKRSMEGLQGYERTLRQMRKVVDI